MIGTVSLTDIQEWSRPQCFGQIDLIDSPRCKDCVLGMECILEKRKK